MYGNETEGTALNKVPIILFILLVPLLSIASEQTAQAQDNPHESIIKLWAPYNRTYIQTEPLHIWALLDIRYGPHDIYSANYTIDDGVSQTVPKESLNPQFWSVTYGAVYVTVDLPALPVGQHKLSLYISVNYTGKNTWLESGEKTVYFTISPTKADDASITGGKVYIYSPSNKSYSPKSIIPIEASASTIAVKNLNYTATYTVDGKGLYTLPTKSFQTSQYDLFFGSVSASGKIYLLPEGKHNVTVYIKACTRDSQNLSVTGEATVYFGVGDISPPNITLNEMDGKNFNQKTIQLNFTLNESASWIAYSLDNGIQTAITSNTTLTAPNGNHTLIVYANDTAGNIGQSQVAHFTVKSESYEQPFTVEMLIIAALVALVITAALGICQKKRKYKVKQKGNLLHFHFYRGAPFGDFLFRLFLILRRTQKLQLTHNSRVGE